MLHFELTYDLSPADLPIWIFYGNCTEFRLTWRLTWVRIEYANNYFFTLHVCSCDCCCLILGLGQEAWVLGAQGAGDCHTACSSIDAKCNDRLGRKASSSSNKESLFEPVSCQGWNGWNYGQGLSQCTDRKCCGDGSCQYHCSVTGSWPGCKIPDGFASGHHSRFCPCSKEVKPFKLNNVSSSDALFYFQFQSSLFSKSMQNFSSFELEMAEI